MCITKFIQTLLLLRSFPEYSLLASTTIRPRGAPKPIPPNILDF
jgi:hypothetical protein